MKLDKTHIRLALFGALLGSLGFACTVESGGVEDDDDDSSSSSGAGAANGSGSGSTGSGSSFYCCINGVGYACPDDAAVDKCIGFDIDGCMAACAIDDWECQDGCWAAWESSTPDPSSCSQDASVTCDGNPTTTGGGGEICVGTWTGANCEVDSDCSTYNCFDNECYENAPGNPCEVDSDCSTYNCYGGCCFGNAAGDPCEVDSDCSSTNCYQNVCQ